jgi:hypothetical protein
MPAPSRASRAVRFSLVVALATLLGALLSPRTSRAQGCPFGLDPRTKQCRDKPFEAVPLPRSLVIESEPPGALVTEDGVALGTTRLSLPEDKRAAPTVGQHEYVLTLPGYYPYSLSVRVQASGPTKPPLARLRPLPRVDIEEIKEGCATADTNAVLTLVRRADEAVVPLADEKRGLRRRGASPTWTVPLEPGGYRVELRAERFETFTRDIEIVDAGDGEPARLRVEYCLRRKPGRLKISTPRFEKVPLTLVPISASGIAGRSFSVVAPDVFTLEEGAYRVEFRDSWRVEPQLVIVEADRDQELQLTLWAPTFPTLPAAYDLEAIETACSANEASACSDAGFIYLHSSPALVTKAENFYRKACVVGDIGGCLGLHFIRRTQRSIDMTDVPSLKELCSGVRFSTSDPEQVALACMYQYARPDAKLDPTSYDGSYGERTDFRLVLRTVGGAWPGLPAVNWGHNDIPAYASASVGMRIALLPILELQVDILGLEYQTIETREVDTDESSRRHLLGSHFGFGAVLQTNSYDPLSFRFAYSQGTYFNESASSPGFVATVGWQLGAYASTHYLEVGFLTLRMPTEAVNLEEPAEGEFLRAGWRGLVVAGYSYIFEL